MNERGQGLGLGRANRTRNRNRAGAAEPPLCLRNSWLIWRFAVSAPQTLGNRRNGAGGSASVPEPGSRRTNSASGPTQPCLPSERHGISTDRTNGRDRSMSARCIQAQCSRFDSPRDLFSRIGRIEREMRPDTLPPRIRRGSASPRGDPQSLHRPQGSAITSEHWIPISRAPAKTPSSSAVMAPLPVPPVDEDQPVKQVRRARTSPMAASSRPDRG